ncbi:MAG: ABC transporter ATP-binding protein [Firmicutes bacterium]|nr:ABC transporter ATP-binding protein [Bacillota bacterium]MCL5039893.1 ABC transporter ATP-binding protein [Bacillota bacterium]
MDVAAYDIDRLTKIYRKGKTPANKGISLKVPQGEVLGVLGPNGAGKTTLVRQMVGLLRPTSGSVRLFGHDVVARPQLVPDLVAYFSQRVAWFGAFTFREVLLHAGILRGVTLGEAKKAAGSLIDRFLCGEFADRYLRHLSGGERRLALLLSTFMSRRVVLVLDEPTNDLDPHRRHLLWAYLLEKNRNEGTTVVLVTHNILEAETVVDRVIIMDDGRIRAQGTPGELKAGLSHQAKIVMTLKVSLQPPAVAGGLLTHVHGQTWEIRVPERQVTSVLAELIGTLGMNAIDRFQVNSCSLEDVYVSLTGRKWDDPVADDP